MADYEAEIAPVKRRVFQHIKTQKQAIGRPLDVLDVGIGTGPNLPYYAADVCPPVGLCLPPPSRWHAADCRICIQHVHFQPLVQARTISGLDPNSFMADYALEACVNAGCEPEKLSVVEGVAEAMPFDDGSFDTVVCTLTLCSVPDPGAALSEMRRVLRPGGALIFVEHVEAFDRGLLRLQQGLLDPLQQAVADGCHLTRDTGGLLTAQPWQSLELERFSVAGASLISPHIAGVGVV